MVFCRWKVGCVMDNKKSLLPVKSDFVFRLIFGDQRNVDILAAFLRCVLDIPDDEYDHLTIVDPYLKKDSDDDSTELWYWMKFIKSDDEGVMDMLATRSPQMRKAVGVLKELSADEATRMRYENREKARRDYESMKDDAVREAEKAEREKWEAVVADKDASLAVKDAEIARLRSELEKKA